MVRLSKALSADQKQSAYLGSLAPGLIVHRYCDFAAKDKFLVLVGLDEGACLFFVINSRCPLKFAGNPRLVACLVSLSPANYPFLAHDSLLNCLEVNDSVAAADLAGELASGVAQRRGELTADTRSLVVAAVRRAPTVRPMHAEIIAAALSGRTSSEP